MAKIPKNLSDKDMFKGWQEEPTIEETMLKAAEPKRPARPQAARAPKSDSLGARPGGCGKQAEEMKRNP